MSPFASVHPFKEVNCRYFDEYGKPVKPFCSQGERCHFIHPNDPNWKGVSSPSDVSIFSRIAPTKPKDRTRQSSGNTTTSRGTKHSTPLVSQSDLFRLKVETDGDKNTLRGKDPPRYRQRTRPRSRSRSKGTSVRNFDARSYSGIYRPLDRSGRSVKESSSHWDLKEGRNDLQLNGAGRRHISRAVDGHHVLGNRFVPPKHCDPPLKNGIFSEPPAQSHYDSVVTQPIAGTGYTSTRWSERVSEHEMHVRKLVDLFRNLARLSHNLAHSTATQDREGKKLQTYNELSSTLLKISPSAAAAVAPALAEITSNHDKAKERVEREFMLLGHLWEDVFDVFVSGITGVIDSSLLNALTTLKTEGEETLKSVAFTALNSSKRKSNSNPGESGEVGCSGVLARVEHGFHPARSAIGEERTHDTKRRRLTGPPSVSDSVDDLQGSGEVVTESDPNIEGILREMRLKMEAQTQSLATLTEENCQLKTSLQAASFASRSSFSSMTSSQPPETPFISSKSSRSNGSRSVDRLLVRELVLKDRRTPTKPSWPRSHRRTSSHRD